VSRGLVTEATERGAARQAFLGAVAELGAAGPLGALRELLARGPWPAPGGNVWQFPRWGDPDEAARLRPGARKLYDWGTARGLFFGLPADLSPLQAANLARWGRRWHLAADWVLNQAALTLWQWTTMPKLAEDPPRWGLLAPIAYFTGTPPEQRRLTVGWEPDVEPRQAAEARIMAEVARWLDEIEAASRRAGWRDAPARRIRGGRRPGWEMNALARYQCLRESQSQLAGRFAMTRQAVALAIEKAAAALPLPLRRP